MDLKSVYVPITLYSKSSKELSEAGDVIESLFGNPSGTGHSSVPYVYCVHRTDLKKSVQSLYNLKLTFRWPLSGVFADETHSKQHIHPTFQEYRNKGYIGVLRKFQDSNRYVIFSVKDYLVRVFDEDSKETLYENDRLTEDVKLAIPGDNWEKVSDYFFHSDTSEYQKQINALMLEKIGAHYINMKRDVFHVGEIARRHDVAPATVVKYLTKILDRINVHKVSGCWISSTKGDYQKTFWMSLGGLCFSDIFQFPSDICSNSQESVIKNRDILHSSICETTFGSEHFRCCRPYHLRLGTSRENAIHIKVRKSLDQLFDFNYEEMQEYCFHILKLSSLIQKQVHVVTKDELNVMRRRKGNKVFYCEEQDGPKKWIEIVGEPDMGDVTEEPNFDEIIKNKDDNDMLWKGLVITTDEEGDDEDQDKLQYLSKLNKKDKS